MTMATIEVIGKSRSSDYGEFRPIKLTLETGEEAWLNLTSTDPVIPTLRKGQEIEVWQNDKGYWKLQQGQGQGKKQSGKPATQPVDVVTLIRQEVSLLNKVKDVLEGDLNITDPQLVALIYRQVSSKS